MTLLEAVSTQELHSVDHDLADALRGIPGALALVTTESLAGTSGICVLDERIADFWSSEAEAIEALLAIRRSHPYAAIDLLCVSIKDAQQMEFPEGSTIYKFR